jgi:dephospho-CoA kinase
MPQKDKKGLADYLITNNGGINNLKTKIPIRKVTEKKHCQPKKYL